MSTTDSTADLLATVADRIKREAYADGWRDAVQAMKKAVDSLQEPAGDGSISTEFATPFSAVDHSMPKIGTTPWHIVQAVKRKPGMSAGEIIETLKTSGHSAPETSIRTSIARMKSRDFIVLRHGKWYPA